MSSTPRSQPDLDDGAAVAALIESFYDRVLADPTLAPIFTEVAGIDLDEHLPRIQDYWRKMLLGERDYDRNMVAQHARIHAHFALQRHHFDRWLALFHEAVDAGFAGPGAERAKTLATRIADNLQRNLDEYAGYTERKDHAQHDDARRGPR